ncbi:serine/threonine-protein kinase [Oscillospiraceae bacterium OttesenSCG-928-F05]|nr:serine/threonine-protein kinase [Oscillospiraceae bacterium OttesenSCG-928-F05]
MRDDRSAGDMDINQICLNCFQLRGAYDVCPYCGFIAGTPPEQAYHLHPGTVLQGRYVVGTVVGFGGFGITYKAWDTKLGILVAIKEFYPAGLVNRIPGETQIVIFSGERSENYTKQKDRFLDEAQQMAKFSGDEHIVNVFDFFEANMTAYIVMEFLNGVTLKEHMAERGGKLSSTEALSIADGLLAAVQSIHTRHIIHRDISPDNIHILVDGRVKLLDFGAARFSEADDDQALAVVIKMGYAPPEQYRSKVKQGPWTDLYAVGATLYKMLTGQTPDESVDRIERDQLKRPSQQGVTVDPRIDKVVMKAMALKPDLRFQKAEDMRRALGDDMTVDFPEEELKKRRTLRTLAAVFAAVLILGGAWITAVFAVQNPASETPLPLDLPVEPGQISLYFDKSFHSEDYIAAFEALVGDFNAQYPEYQIRFISDDSSDVHAAAIQNGSAAPTLYQVPRDAPSGVGDTASYDELLDALSTEDILFYDRYREIIDANGSIPLGFNVLCGYANTALAVDRGVAVFPEVDQSLRLLDTAMYEGANLLIQRNYFGDFMDLTFPSFIGGGALYPSDEGHALLMNLMAHYDAEGFPQDLADELEVFLADELVYYVSSTADFREIQTALPGLYRAFPLRNEGASRAIFEDRWCIGKNATENERMIALLFLRYMLDDYAQNTLYLQQDGAIPLNQNIFAMYTEINPELYFIAEDLGGYLFYTNRDDNAAIGLELAEALIRERSDEALFALYSAYASADVTDGG